MSLRRSLACAFAVTAAAIVFSSVSFGQSGAAEDRVLVIGTKEAAPFSFKDGGGEWQGISVELWTRIAARLGLRYEIREAEIEELLEGVSTGELDAAAAAMTVTVEREQAVDFSHPYFSSGLGIAVALNQSGGWMKMAKAFFSPAFFEAVAALAVVLLVAGGLVWLFERRRNADQFGGAAHEGLAAAFWWSAVTMTTVGYGDKAPKTVGGRIVALVWMFVSLIIVSGFIAGISSALTINQLSGRVSGPEDLPGREVATVPGTTSEKYLRDHRMSYRRLETPAAALKALAAGEVDAVIYDRPILQHLIAQSYRGRLEVLPHILDRELYAIALPPGSPRREAINRALLEIVGTDAWADLVERYLGDE